MSLAQLSAGRQRHEVITPRSSQTHGSSFLAGSTDTTSLTKYTYLTSPPRRTSPKSQVSASTHNDTISLMPKVDSPSHRTCITCLIFFPMIGQERCLSRRFFRTSHFVRSGVVSRSLRLCGSDNDARVCCCSTATYVFPSLLTLTWY